MARMIPQTPMPDEFNRSYGEKKVYEALKALPEEYIVFHSVHWQKGKRVERLYGGNLISLFLIPNEE